MTHSARNSAKFLFGFTKQKRVVILIPPGESDCRLHIDWFDGKESHTDVEAAFGSLQELGDRLALELPYADVCHILHDNFVEQSSPLWHLGGAGYAPDDRLEFKYYNFFSDLEGGDLFAAYSRHGAMIWYDGPMSFIARNRSGVPFYVECVDQPSDCTVTYAVFKLDPEFAWNAKIGHIALKSTDFMEGLRLASKAWIVIDGVEDAAAGIREVDVSHAADLVAPSRSASS